MGDLGDLGNLGPDTLGSHLPSLSCRSFFEPETASMKAITISAAAATFLVVASAQTSNPYLTYSTLCPAATVAASSK